MRYVFGLGAVAIIVFTLFIAFDPSYQQERRTAAYIEQQRATMQLERERLQLEQAKASATAYTSLGFVYTAIPLVIMALVLYIGFDYYKQRRTPLVRPDARGLLPVARVQIEQSQLDQAVFAALAAFHRTQAISAAHAPLADKLNYSITIKDGSSLPAVETPLLPQAGAPAHVPTFTQLLDQGVISRDAPLVLGYTDEGPLQGSWRDLYSSAVAGVQGSGKSVTQRFHICQAALHGARFVIIDPHIEADPDESLAATLAPLAPLMLCEPTGDPRGILATVKLITARLDARLHGDRDRTPLLYVIDEFTACMRSAEVAELLALLLERIATEGRKVGIFALLGGQTWSAARSGGTPLRNALASAYVHRIKRPEALKLLQLGEDTPQTHDLPTGGAWLYRTSGDLVRVQVPLTTRHDVAHVAALLAPTSNTTSQRPVIDGSAASPSNPVEVAHEAAYEVASPSPLQAHQNALDARSERVRELLRAETPHKAILAELWGITSAGGAGYTNAARELREIIAKLV